MTLQRIQLASSLIRPVIAAFFALEGFKRPAEEEPL